MCLNKVRAYKTLTEIFGQSFSNNVIYKVLKTQKTELVPKWIWAKTKGLIFNADDWGTNNQKLTAQIRGKLINKASIPIDTSLSMKQIESTCKKVYGGIEEIIIVSGGVNWIINYQSYLANSKVKRYIDSFQYHKYVKGPTRNKIKVGWKLYINLLQRGVLELFTYYNSWWKWCSSI